MVFGSSTTAAVFYFFFMDLILPIPLNIIASKGTFRFISIVFEILCLFLHVVRRRQNVLFEFESDFFRKRQIIHVLQSLHSSESDHL